MAKVAPGSRGDQRSGWQPSLAEPVSDSQHDAGWQHSSHGVYDKRPPWHRTESGSNSSRPDHDQRQCYCCRSYGHVNYQCPYQHERDPEQAAYDHSRGHGYIDREGWYVPNAHRKGSGGGWSSAKYAAAAATFAGQWKGSRGADVSGPWDLDRFADDDPSIRLAIRFVYVIMGIFLVAAWQSGLFSLPFRLLYAAMSCCARRTLSYVEDTIIELVARFLMVIITKYPRPFERASMYLADRDDLYFLPGAEDHPDEFVELEAEIPDVEVEVQDAAVDAEPL